jgi:hypothetical protein
MIRVFTILLSRILKRRRRFFSAVISDLLDSASASRVVC